MVGSLVFIIQFPDQTKLSAFNDNTLQLLEKPSKAQGSQLEFTYKAHIRWDRDDREYWLKV